jgi:hypothetical protein
MLELGKYPLREGQEMTTSRREPKPAALPFPHLRAQLALELAYCVAQSRLREPQLPSRSRQRASLFDPAHEVEVDTLDY